MSFMILVEGPKGVFNIMLNNQHHMVTFIADAIEVAFRLVSAERSLTHTAHFLQQPMEYIRPGNFVPSAGAIIPRPDGKLMADLSIFLGSCQPQYVVTPFMSDDGQVKPGDPTRIFVNQTLVERGGSAYFFQEDEDGRARYRMHVLHFACVVAHEYQHYLRINCSKAMNFSLTTPPKLRTANGLFRTEAVDGRPGVWQTGEGGWIWEMSVIGGRLAGVFRPTWERNFDGQLCRLDVLGLDSASRGIYHTVPQLVIDSIVLDYQGWWLHLPLFRNGEHEWIPDGLAESDRNRLVGVHAESSGTLVKEENFERTERTCGR